MRRPQAAAHHRQRGGEFGEKATPARFGAVQSFDPQQGVEQRGVQACAEADGEREADVFERHDEGKVHDLGNNQREHGDFHRRFDVLFGIKGGREHLDHNLADNAEGAGHQRVFGHHRVVGGEAFVDEHGGDQRVGEHGQPQRGGRGQQATQPQPPVEQFGKLARVAPERVFGQGGQQDGAEGDAEHAGGQFGEAVGVIHPGNAAALQVGGEYRVDNKGNLSHAGGEDGGHHLFDHAVDRRVFEIELGQVEKALFRQPGQLEGQLQDTADKHRPGQRGNRRVEIGNEKQGKGDERQVEQNRREGGDLEFVVGVENRADKRRQGNQKDIGKHNPQQVGCQREFVGIFGKARRRDADNPRRGQHAESGYDGEREGEHSGDVLHKLARRLGRFGLSVFGQHRHERLRERAFGEDAPQQVGQLEGGEKRVGGIARAEHPRNDHVADKAEDAREHGHAAEFAEDGEQVHSRCEKKAKFCNLA